MTKPIDLIVANTMHDIAETIRAAQAFTRAVGGKFSSDIDQDARDAIARMLLRNVARDAPLSAVLKALKIIGAPNSHDDIDEAVKSVMESQE